MSSQNTKNLERTAHVEDVQLYINGKFINAQSGAAFDNVNPFTNKVNNHVAEGRSEDVNKAVKAAKKAFEQGPWRKLKIDERMKYIHHIADLIDKEKEEIAILESIDTGLPISQTRKQAARAAENFRFYARVVQTKLHGESYPVDDEFINYTVYKPLGVVGLITPWNAPFMLETWKVAPALATGNTIVLKPAELSPLTANKLAEIIDKAGLPEGVFNVVHGFGETAGAALVAHPEVKAISFTGETTTGSTIIKNSADTLKKTSMELGGKSPLIVFEDADLERALDAAVWGIFSFNGERCTANSRVFLHKNIKDKFIKALKERVANIKIGDPMDPSTQLGPLIEKKHFKKVNNYIEIAKEEGCEVVQGVVPEKLKGGNFVPPTLLLNAKNDMRVCQEEIFGPVMAVIEFETDEEVVEAANNVRYGLAGYVWTSDLKRAHRVAQAVEAGMLWINAQNVRDLRIPFGGTKDSGIGREGGHYAIFEFYTEPKVIHVAIGDHHIPQFGKKN
ncbi:5-carboxymethyl-2-hydroxymuconate semialdehyde dehydrogenase [Bacillus safensis]|uniref:5-carboxymethyl-2-hydroxymuconate semialdehyde dehydrogenase n=1 Tax=Bacillus safensis TaxID=561879 RepID=UPI00227F83BB|nr:5-carboxymethyl-2-hydroxymuconate semialdehyde dehydrogenase [Bacillus safensis]MCY7493677.1 5-carboxymethyl-2-hydroxymuconate semialdehyde dehydrogenase [Bacillus safensis]MED4993120.1 5-carboxymethyl-2-hydroxymuconate semialdehyde dehydrogenase [Bacillus safensis]